MNHFELCYFHPVKAEVVFKNNQFKIKDRFISLTEPFFPLHHSCYRGIQNTKYHIKSGFFFQSDVLCLPQVVHSSASFSCNVINKYID